MTARMRPADYTPEPPQFGWPMINNLFRVHDIFAIAAKRKPDLIIGPGYIQRWIISDQADGRAYLHRMVGANPNNLPHDHAGDNFTIVLDGGYREQIWQNGKNPNQDAPETFYRGRGDIVFRRAEDPHRIIEVDPDRGAWTLWLRSPRRREWGFHCPLKGWGPWTDYVDPADPGQIGAGCGGGEAPTGDLGAG